MKNSLKQKRNLNPLVNGKPAGYGKTKLYRLLYLFWIFVLLHFLNGCAAGLLTRSIQVQRTGTPATNDNTALVTVQFRAFSGQGGGNLYLTDLENSIRNSIYNSGQFKEVRLKNESADKDYSAFFEVTVVPSDNGKIRWGVSWPAVYPMPLYWPLQQKEGFAEVLLNVKVTTPGSPVQEFYVKKDTHYFIHFYSFFRTGPIEDALQASYYDAMDELSQRVRNLSLESVAYEQPKMEPGKKTNIAVLDLEAVSVSVSEARTLTDKLRGELIRTGRFQVIERSQMEEILKEQGFQQTGLCNTTECYVEAGKLLGVEQMIGGSIGKVGNIYLISIRLIDVETGVIVKLVDQEIEGSVDEVLKTGIRSVAQKMSR
jgi:TolB-like protein